MAATNLDEKWRERRFKRILPKLLKDINALSAQCGVEACVITKGPRDTRPTIWASPAMTGKLLEANKEAEVDHLLREKKRLEDKSVKLKQLQELDEKLKEKKR
ncbi:agamous-like MADS-box protein AGL36-like [Trifolium medium]|uniref:Agamous-like MADS-box protein AGL36-like n=1 Tax=Trifolium medium TaxID=97028 RepID=A0A392RXV3_9FABA|nr:agamous-like MADS-box protein AGL36-like [Trifolium medium]